MSTYQGLGPQVCPECSVGKHGNCNGQAWDTLTDTLTLCPCSLDGHPAVGTPVEGRKS